MKVLFISEGYPSDSKPQYCIFLEQQAIALKSLGNEVSILLPEAANHNSELRKQNRKGIKTYSFSYKNSLLKKLGLGYNINPVLMRFLTKHDFDIVAIQICSISLKTEIIRLCNKLEIPVVIHYHGLNIWHDYYPTHKLHEKMILPVKIWQSKNINAAICVSRSVEKVFRENNKHTPAYVVYNGADLDLFKPNLNKNNKSYTIVCVANLIPIKGHQYLIEAISKLVKRKANVHLDIIGEGYIRNLLEEQVRELDVSDSISFLGTLPYEDVAKRMSDSDMFILPSYFDASPCVCYEAMASGTLTVGCNIYGPSELIEDRVTGLLVAPKSSNSIVKAIEYAIKNPDKVDEMIQNGILESKNKTWKKSAFNLNQVYSQIISL